MSDLDQLYVRLLHHGLVKLRDLVAGGDDRWAFATAEMLHQVPSLLGETNERRHVYFWRSERGAYLEWLRMSGNEDAASYTRTFYEPIWREMEIELGHLLARD